MNNKIWIGNNKKGCTWTKIFTHKGNVDVSENTHSYMCKIYDIDLMICKDTVEGANLTSYIELRLYTKTDDFILYCLLQYLTIDIFEQIITNQYDTGFNDGQNSKINEIKSVLKLK